MNVCLILKSLELEDLKFSSIFLSQGMTNKLCPFIFANKKGKLTNMRLAIINK